MQINNPNEKTLDAYNKRLLDYIKHTPQEFQPEHHHLLKFIHTALSFVKKDALIFEIGSGTGRDARFIRQQGHTIICSDAAVSFVDYLAQNGEDALAFNALTDEFPFGCDMIYANAVVQHFTDENTQLVLRKAHSALKKNGVLALTVKQGEGETWVREKFNNKRYINFWRYSDLKRVMKREGYDIVYSVDGLFGDLPTHTWIHIIGKKIEK